MLVHFLQQSKHNTVQHQPCCFLSCLLTSGHVTLLVSFRYNCWEYFICNYIDSVPVVFQFSSSMSNFSSTSSHVVEVMSLSSMVALHMSATSALEWGLRPFSKDGLEASSKPPQLRRPSKPPLPFEAQFELRKPPSNPPPPSPFRKPPFRSPPCKAPSPLEPPLEPPLSPLRPKSKLAEVEIARSRTDGVCSVSSFSLLFFFFLFLYFFYFFLFLLRLLSHLTHHFLFVLFLFLSQKHEP